MVKSVNFQFVYAYRYQYCYGSVDQFNMRKIERVDLCHRR